MGLKHHPRVVTSGSIYYFDAANPRSYVGSGVTFNGLIAGLGGTLVNGVGFGTTNSGYFIFDGTNDGIPFFLPNVGSIVSIQMWAKLKSTTSGMMYGFNLYDVWINSGRLGFNTGVSDIYGLTSTQVTNLNLLNQWKHFIFEMRSDVAYSNNKIYINGENQSLSQVAGTENTTNRNFNSGNGRIGCWLANELFYQSMDVAQFQVYNRALTQQEITQNYNATKMRYL